MSDTHQPRHPEDAAQVLRFQAMYKEGWADGARYGALPIEPGERQAAISVARCKAKELRARATAIEDATDSAKVES